MPTDTNPRLLAEDGVSPITTEDGNYLTVEGTAAQNQPGKAKKFVPIPYERRRRRPAHRR